MESITSIEAWGILAQIITTIATVAIAFTAIIGLNTWKKQEKTKKNDRIC
jgi:hypothetical protein